MTFNEKLQGARQKSGLTQAELAKRIGVSSRSIQNYEHGSRYPKRDILKAICRELNVKIEYLVSSDDYLGTTDTEDESHGVETARILLTSAGTLFAGNELSEDDKDKVMLALQKIYWKAKEKNMGMS